MQALRFKTYSLLDSKAGWRDWKTYRIVSVSFNDKLGYVLDLETNQPSLYDNIDEVKYTDFLYLRPQDRNAIVANTTGDELRAFADMETEYDQRQQQRVTDAVEADNRVKYRRAQAPESFLLYNDAREELDQLRRSMRRDDVPERVVVDDEGNEEQQVAWIRRAIAKLQQQDGDAAKRNAEIQRLRVEETQLVQQWNRILDLAKTISTSEWVRDKEPWGPLYNPQNNREREAILYEIMTSFPTVIQGHPVELPPRTVTYNIMH